MEYILPIICSLAILGLLGALIFNASFRADILTTNSEARIFGIINVKGVAIIVLSGLFLGGLIWSFTNSKQEKSNELTIALANNQSMHLNEIKIKTENIENELLAYYTDQYVPAFAKNFAEQIPAGLNLDSEIENIIATSSSENIKSFRSAFRKVHELRDKCYANIRDYHADILEAVEKNNEDEYLRLMNNRPQLLVDLANLESKITAGSNGREKKLIDFMEYIDQYLNEEYNR